MLIASVRLYREGLAEMVRKYDDIDLIGTAGSLQEALEDILRARPSFVLLDHPFPEGPQVAKRLLRLAPGVRVVAMGVDEVEDEILAWAGAGAAGYVSRNNSVEELVAAVRSAASDDVACSPRIAGILLRHVRRQATRPLLQHHPSHARGLTAREQEIAELIAGALSNKQIATVLGISLPTVKNHVHSIFEKLEVHRRADVRRVLGRAEGVEERALHLLRP